MGLTSCDISSSNDQNEVTVVVGLLYPAKPARLHAVDSCDRQIRFAPPLSDGGHESRWASSVVYLRHRSSTPSAF